MVAQDLAKTAYVQGIARELVYGIWERSQVRRPELIRHAENRCEGRFWCTSSRQVVLADDPLLWLGG
jgi:hypothetical protein